MDQIMFLLDFFGVVLLLALLGYTLILGAPLALRQGRIALLGIPDPATPMHPVVTRVAASLANQPDEWCSHDHTTKHRPSGLEIWSCNGESHVKFYRVPAKPGQDYSQTEDKEVLTKSERHILWQALEQHRKETHASKRNDQLVRVRTLLDASLADASPSGPADHPGH